MNKILSTLIVSLLVTVAIPVSALAACSHGHGSGAAGLASAVQQKLEFCKGGGYIYINDLTAHCPAN